MNIFKNLFKRKKTESISDLHSKDFYVVIHNKNRVIDLTNGETEIHIRLKGLNSFMVLGPRSLAEIMLAEIEKERPSASTAPCEYYKGIINP